LDPYPANISEYTVSELSRALKRDIEERFGQVRVRGEISGFKRAASGHLYMSLKDENAVIDAVCWRGIAERLRFPPEDGLEVICTGKVTTYPQRSKYQIVIESLEPAGEGALMALLEERRRKLAAEGLFDAERKRPIPYIPKRIGIVTSPTGAVIRDILHRLSDRFPRPVLLWPVRVQGEGAAEEIARAIRGFSRMYESDDPNAPDVVIVARGGGSLEDLWAFNEEVVVRAAAECSAPLVSAVGHETDTTLIDHAADLRAPTPTAAAEMVVPVRAELVAAVAEWSRRLQAARLRTFAALGDKLQGLARGLPRPRDLLGLARQRVDDFSERLPRALIALPSRHRLALSDTSARLPVRLLRESFSRRGDRLTEIGERLRSVSLRRIRDEKIQLDNLSRMLASLSYEKVLERGFAVVYDNEGAPITGVAAVRPNQLIGVRMHDGRFAARVEGDTRRGKGKKSRTRTSADGPRQGKLL